MTAAAKAANAGKTARLSATKNPPSCHTRRKGDHICGLIDYINKTFD